MVFLPFNEKYTTGDGKEIEFREVFVHVHLNKRPFWSRIKYAIKYIFGHQSKYGAFDEFIFDKDNVGKLKDVIDYIQKQ
jgi:hypothetical protein